MANQTKIEWTDATANFWVGCQKVGPGCDNCYAEAGNKRFKGGRNWGAGAPRDPVAAGFKTLRKLQRTADAFHAQHGHWPRVFCSSVSDIFDNAVDTDLRMNAFKAIEEADKCRIQLLTKRVGNVFQMIPAGWASSNLSGWPAHVGLMITVVNQTEADRDIRKLLDLKDHLDIPWVGLSMEPLLGPVDISSHLRPVTVKRVGSIGPPRVLWPALDWVIVGGESGRNARPLHPDWARSLRDQCEAASVPFFFKQWGEWGHQSCDPDGQWNWSAENAPIEIWDNGNAGASLRIGKTAAGRTLDGRTHDAFPKALTC